MGLASVLGLTKNLEPLLWTVIGVFCAVWIARKLRANYFLHGLLTGLIGGGIAPLIQVLLFSTYLKNNPELAANFSQLPPGFSPRTFFLLLVPVIAVLSGVLMGSLSWITAKIVKSHD